MPRKRMKEEPGSYKNPVGRPKGLKVKKKKLKESIKKRYTFALTDRTAEQLKRISDNSGLSMSTLVDKAVSLLAEKKELNNVINVLVK